jgi:very-short-patch-repair endonuclease
VPQRFHRNVAQAKHSLYIIRYTNEEIFKKEDEVVDDIRMTVIELLKMK